jgi:hypothetical protein
MISTYLIKKYKQFNESIKDQEAYDEASSIVRDIESICEDLKDDGIEFEIYPNPGGDQYWGDSSYLELLGHRLIRKLRIPIELYVRVMLITNPNDKMNTLNERQKQTIIKVFKHLENYANQIDIEFQYDYEDVSGYYKGSTSGFDETVFDRYFSRLNGCKEVTFTFKI